MAPAEIITIQKMELEGGWWSLPDEDAVERGMKRNLQEKQILPNLNSDTLTVCFTQIQQVKNHRI